MKIDPTNAIRITGSSIPADALRGIPRGAEIPARILDRLGPREAIIELAGTRVRAEFLKGVPPEGAVTLRLEEAGRASFLFKMVDPAAREELARLVMEFILPGRGGMRDTVIHELNAAMARNPSGILELNALLLGRNPKDMDRGMARFLTHLLRLGASPAALADLSVILSGLGGPPAPLRALLRSLGFEERTRRGVTSSSEAALSGALETVIGDIEAIDDPAERESVLRRLVALLSENADDGETSRSGEFALCHDGAFHPVRYLEAGGSWVFSVEFSNIGVVELLAGEIRGSRFLSVFAGSSGALEALEKSKKNLMGRIKKIDPSIHINFYTTRQALNKIVEINSHYSVHSVFDIRV